MKRQRPPLAIHGVAAWLRLFPQAAVVSCGVGALRFVEALVSHSPDDTAPRLLEAVLAGSVFWLASAGLGAIALLAWAIRRGLGIEPPPEPVQPHLPTTREGRLRGWGFGIVAGWAAMSVLVLIVMSETRTGPFARLATGFLGLRDFAGLATFLLGLPVVLSPLLLLALLPWQARWPLLAGMQAAVKSPPSPTRRRRRR